MNRVEFDSTLDEMFASIGLPQLLFIFLAVTLWAVYRSRGPFQK